MIAGAGGRQTADALAIAGFRNAGHDLSAIAPAARAPLPARDDDALVGVEFDGVAALGLEVVVEGAARATEREEA